MSTLGTLASRKARANSPRLRHTCSPTGLPAGRRDVETEQDIKGELAVMTQAKTATTPYGWTVKTFRSDVPPAKRQLALALQGLCRHLTPPRPEKARRSWPTQAAAARHVHVGESSLSRFLSGRSVPALETLEFLYKTASADAGGDDQVGMTLAELTELHAQTRAEHCGRCLSLQANADAAEAKAISLGRQLQRAEGRHAEAEENADKLGTLRREVTALRTKASELEASLARLRAIRAGLEARLAARTTAAPLPVPHRKGDRQRSARNEAAARNVAQQAAELTPGGRHEAALPVLRHTAETLSTAELATLLCLLRQQRNDEFADTLIHMYGRDQSHHDVVHAAVALHEHGAHEDAAALLRVRAALE